MHPSLIDMKLLYVIWNAEVIYWHVTLSAATRVDSDKCVERVELEKAVEICEKMQLRICTRDEVTEMGSCKHRIVLVHPRSSILHQLMPTTLLHLQLPLLLVKSPWDLCLSCEYCCVASEYLRCRSRRVLVVGPPVRVKGTRQLTTMRNLCGLQLLVVSYLSPVCMSKSLAKVSMMIVNAIQMSQQHVWISIFAVVCRDLIGIWFTTLKSELNPEHAISRSFWLHTTKTAAFSIHWNTAHWPRFPKLVMHRSRILPSELLIADCSRWRQKKAGGIWVEDSRHYYWSICGHCAHRRLLLVSMLQEAQAEEGDCQKSRIAAC